MDLDPDLASDLIFLLGMVLVAFGLGLRWSTFAASGNYVTPLGYTAVLVFAGAKVWVRMQEDGDD